MINVFRVGFPIVGMVCTTIHFPYSRPLYWARLGIQCFRVRVQDLGLRFRVWVMDSRRNMGVRNTEAQREYQHDSSQFLTMYNIIYRYSAPKPYIL